MSLPSDIQDRRDALSYRAGELPPRRPHFMVTAGKRRAAGFTLLEVVLAITITIGILVVALYFYRQAAELRTQLLQASERVASVRLLLDRITADLRCAYGTFTSGGGVSGDAASLRIVKTELPSRTAWSGGHLGRAAAAETDLKSVSYRASTSLEGTNTVITGLVRTEESLVQKRNVSDARRANQVGIAMETPARRGPEPLTDSIHFIRFRYWSGSGWQESWSRSDLPQGVEVSLGGEALPEGVLPDDYPYEVFRRVIFLPGSRPSAAFTASSEATEVFP